MSEIKNTPGVPGGPGPVDDPNKEELQNPQRGERFRKIARQMREKKLEDLQAALLKNSPTTQGDTSIDALRRKTQLQGQPGSTPAVTPQTPDAQGPSLTALFGSGSGAQKPVATNPLAAAAPVFRPTFMGDVANTNIASGLSSPLNPMYFATPDTAQYLIQQKLPQLGFPGATTFMKNSGSQGGPFVANQQEIWIRLPNGTEMNAGFLADYYKRNPEDKFPGLADKYVKDIINGEIQAQAGKGIQS